MVYWNTQEVIQALLGGALIALSATLNLLYYGRISGLSGMFYSVSTLDKTGGLYWKYSFLCGLLTIPVLGSLIFGNILTMGDLNIVLFDSDFYSVMNLSIAGWFLGGFLVGVGTKMGNGCTSGHGVCGIPRLSIRSIIATCTFMATGIAMATLRYYVPFFHNGKYFGDTYYNAYHWVFLGVFIVLMLGYVGLLVANFQMEWVHNYLFGFIFGFGLVLSGMCRISKI